MDYFSVSNCNYTHTINSTSSTVSALVACYYKEDGEKLLPNVTSFLLFDLSAHCAVYAVYVLSKRAETI